MSAAFQSIMKKRISDDEDSDAPKVREDLTLSKYKKKTRELDARKEQEEEAQKRRQQKEQRRLMGRLLPTKAEVEYERELQIIATKGVVQLFNAVAEYQGQLTREINQEEREKKEKRMEVINSTGADKNQKGVGFGSVIEKIQSK